MPRVMDAGRLRLIRPSDFDLSKCGLPIPPDDVDYVDITRIFTFSKRQAAATTSLDDRQAVDSDADFYLCSISGLPVSNLFIRWGYANGRYTSNIRQHSLQAYSLWDLRRTFQTLPRYPAGTWIPIELENRAAAAVADVILTFEGYNRYYLCKR